MRANWFNLMLRCLVVLGLVALVGAGWLFWRMASLQAGFSRIYPDESEAKLLEIVGAPSAIRRCDEGHHKVQPSETRPCARVYWYDTYIFSDGWLIPIDEQGSIMQINRLGLP
jgi:hypothetical protein